ncbi:MAG: EmrB/QacA family drug resistance transporter [Rhodospirillales bacterium 20-64-7]|nr:MAG: EmrB/QacA family drug resistance transporter [Rhodospirillales bacterium 20-64-7]
MEVLDTTIVNVALPHIAGNLSVSEDDATWALTIYLIANAIVLTISGSLSRRFGRKRFFMICVGVFALASLGCGICTSFMELLMFRAVQGFFGGGLQPTQQAIILDTFPPEKRGQAFALTAVAIIIAPVIGPVVGGYLTQEYSWHLIFLINVPVGIATLFGVWRMVEDSPTVKREMRTAPSFDYIGTGFIAVALGCLELAADRGEDLDWLASNFICAMFLLSALAFIFGILYLLYTEHPIVDLRVFKDRNFALGFIEIGIMGLVLYTSAVLIPQFAQQQLGYTATWAGFVLAPGAIVLALLIPLVGQLLKIVPAKYTIAAGGLALASALFYSMHLVPKEDFFHLALLRAAQTSALSLLFVPISTITFATLPQRLNGDGSALFAMSRNVFGGIGISVATAMVTSHEQMNQQNLVRNLTPLYRPYDTTLAQIQHGLVAAGDSMAQAMSAAPGKLYQMLQSQVALLAYIDVFFISGVMALAIVPAALLMSRGKASR